MAVAERESRRVRGVILSEQTSGIIPEYAIIRAQSFFVRDSGRKALRLFEREQNKCSKKVLPDLL